MAILWRVNPRQGRSSLIGKITDSLPGSTAAGFNVNYDEFFGLVGPETSAQGQTIDAAIGVLVDGPVTTSQGQSVSGLSGTTVPFDLATSQGQTIDAAGALTADASATTSQGQTIDAAGSITAAAAIDTSQGQTIDAAATMFWVATATTGQGSQTLDVVASASGTITYDSTVITEQGVRHADALWRASPRALRVSWLAQLANANAGSVLYAVAADEFFHGYGPINGQTIDAVGDVQLFARTAQGGQTIDAEAAITGAFTAQGQTIDATGIVLSNIVSIRTAQGQSINVLVIWDIDAAIATSQAQTIAAVGIVPINATVGTAQGQSIDMGPGNDARTSQALQSVNGVLGGEFEQIVTPAGFSSLAFGTPFLYSTTLSITGFDSLTFGTTHIQNATRPMQGFTTLKFGTAKIQNLTSYVRPAGIDGLKWGRPFMRSDALQPVSFDTLTFGDATIDFYIRTVYPDSEFDDYLEFGEATISNFEQYQPIEGFDSVEWGLPFIYSDAISMSVGSTLRFGGLTNISNYIRYVPVQGFDAGVDTHGHALMGLPTIFNYDTYLHLHGFDSAVVPRPLQIDYKNRTRQMVGLSWTRFGNPRIFNWLQYINLNGWDNAVVWDDFGPVNPETGYPARVWLVRQRPQIEGFDSAVMGHPHLTQGAGNENVTACP